MPTEKPLGNNKLHQAARLRTLPALGPVPGRGGAGTDRGGEFHTTLDKQEGCAMGLAFCNTTSVALEPRPVVVDVVVVVIDVCVCVCVGRAPGSRSPPLPARRVPLRTPCHRESTSL